MNIGKSLGVLALATLTLFSCKKREGDNNSDENNVTVSDFMSTKVGSWWLYASNEGHVNLLEATGRDSTIDNAPYDYYTMTDTASRTQYVTHTFYAKNGHNYLNLIDLDGSQTSFVPAIVFVDSATVGQTWLNTHRMRYSGLNVDIEIEGTVTAINATEVINGKTYNNVTKVKSTLRARQIPLVPVWTNCGTVDMWFVKGIGVLKRKLDISILSFYTRDYEENIIDYHIEE